MQFDRWQYDPEANAFLHRPVTAVISTVADHAYAVELLRAHLDQYVRLVTRLAQQYDHQLAEIQKRIEGDGE